MGDAAEHFRFEISDTIRSHAMSFPEATEGSSCVNRAFKAGGKNFVFLGEKDAECNVRLKLSTSIAEFEKLAENDPNRWQVGKGGWAMLRFDPERPPPVDDLERWITESFFLLAPKRVSKLVD